MGARQALVVSAGEKSSEARLAELVARAAADRQKLAHLLDPVTKLDRALDKVRAWKLDGAAAAVGGGLALSAMLLALPAGRSPIVRGGIALLQLASSVRRLFARPSSAGSTGRP